MDQKERLLREKIRTGLINLVDKTLEDKDVGPDLLHLMKIFNIPKELLGPDPKLLTPILYN